MNRRVFLFAGRNMKEILRDPINLFFGLGFPVVFLLILLAVYLRLYPRYYLFIMQHRQRQLL